VTPAASRLLSRARAAGAEEAEVYYAHSTEFTVKVFRGEVESLVSAESRGVGIRTLREHRLGFAYSSGLDPATLEVLAEEALRNGRYNQPDEANVLPDPARIEPVPGLASPDFAAAAPAQKVQLALDLEQRTIGRDPRVKRVSTAVYSDGYGRVEIVNSRGLEAQFERSVAYGVVNAIAEQNGEMQSGFAFTYGRDAAALDVRRTAEEAVQRAVSLLGARRVPSARVPVVLDPYPAAMILGVMADAFDADAVLKRRSLLAGRTGQSIGSPAVSIADDARLAEGLASRPCDGEGVPTQRNELVRGGVLQGFLHNTYTARRSGDRSTGSAVRSYRSVPEVGVSNLVLAPGELTPRALLGRVRDGLYVSEVHGLGTVNPISGEFSLGLTGHWIRGGELAHPVRELTVAGNLIDLLSRVVAVADDLRFMFAGGFCGSPTVLIEELPVGGA